jgi:hypothetical protein
LQDPGRKPGVFVWYDGIENCRRGVAGDRLCHRLGAVRFQRMILLEIPFMPARFVWFSAAVSLPFPFLAAAIAMMIGKP